MIHVYQNIELAELYSRLSRFFPIKSTIFVPVKIMMTNSNFEPI